MKWILGSALIAVLLFVAGQAQIVVVGGFTHEFEVQAGGVYEGEIVVSNPSTAPVTMVAVTQGDYLFFADGRSIYGDPGSVARSNTSWITLYLPPRFVIEPGERVPVRFRIEVPDDLSLVGTYWSMLFVAPVLAPAEAPAEGLSFRQLTRFGIQVVTHVGDTGDRAIRNIGSEMVRTEAGLFFQLDLENTGERWLRPVVYAEFYDLEGNALGEADSTRGRLRMYPGCSVRHRIPLPDLDVGTYLAVLFIDNLDEHVWGTQVTLAVEE